MGTSPITCKSNLDYYRGMTKSIYEKEPLFLDFARNIPLSQSNLYDNNNLSKLKRSFQFMLFGSSNANIPDPYKPSAGATDFLHKPMSEQLSRKHGSSSFVLSPLPYIHVYHRNTR